MSREFVEKAMSGLWTKQPIPTPITHTISAWTPSSGIIVQPGDILGELGATHGFNWQNAHIKRNGQIYEIGPDGIMPENIQPGDEIIKGESPVQRVTDAANERGSQAEVEKTTETCCPAPPWMPIAWGEEAKDVREDLPGNHPDIIKYHKLGRYNEGGYSEKTSWCGTFVAWCLMQSGYSKDQLSTVPERALTWGRTSTDSGGWWPTGVNIGRPIYGAIATKERSGGGHVTFVVGKDPNDPNTLYCLGGNQGNRLKVSKYERSAFHAFTLPENYRHECCELPDWTGKAAVAESEE